MLTSPPRAVATLAGALYAYAFLSEFVLLYPVYTLLFTEAGLSVAETSSLFVIWAVTGMLLEVPSGAWADAVSRRLLLFAAPVLTGAGFALWTLTPSYWAFAAGFVLWGAGGALTSGAYEALAYEELDRLGRADRYVTMMGRARAAGLVADASAIALAVPVFAAGGYPAVGAASVAACVLCAVSALALPEHRTPARAAGGGYLATLRAGVAEVRGDRRVLGAVLLVTLVTAIWGALEEYVPYLAAETGVPTTTIPLLVLVVWVGATVGGLLSEAARRLPARLFALVLALAAAAMAVGALSGSPAGFAPVALAFGTFQMAAVVADAGLQERLSGRARATVTSVAGLGTNLVTLGVYTAYGSLSAYASHGVSFALLVLPYALVALWLWRSAPGPRGGRRT
ncbi:MFS transporter [Nonomuraea pusilla]|uniref:MFS transporter n=1 Tax=Nonomuraea pusilla TaxID=46177 RepID=UPI003319779F